MKAAPAVTKDVSAVTKAVPPEKLAAPAVKDAPPKEPAAPPVTNAVPSEKLDALAVKDAPPEKLDASVDQEAGNRKRDQRYGRMQVLSTAFKVLPQATKQPASEAIRVAMTDNTPKPAATPMARTKPKPRTTSKTKLKIGESPQASQA